MNPLNYMRLHDHSSRNPRQQWTNASNGKISRLSRNCTDWYPLLDLCAYNQCLIADRDGVYDAATPNGRLLLGLKNPSLYNTSFTY